MVATRPITIDEFARMPLEGSWELIDGEPVELSPSADISGWISGRLFSRLGQFVGARGLGWAFPPKTGFVLFDDRSTVRSPDGAFVRGDRLPKLTGHFVPLAPDLAVEVLSPSDRMTDALGKVGMYLDAGVRLIWLVDPAINTVTIYRPGAAPTTLREGDTLDGGNVLPDFRVQVAEIFA
jgi:Uma2 family endonuclease